MGEVYENDEQFDDLTPVERILGKDLSDEGMLSEPQLKYTMMFAHMAIKEVPNRCAELLKVYGVDIPDQVVEALRNTIENFAKRMQEAEAERAAEETETPTLQ